MLLDLALRNVLRQKGRTALTLATVVTGVAALIISGGFVADTFVQLAEAVIHSQLGHIQIAQKGYFSRGSRAPAGYLIDSQPVLSVVSKAPGVKEAMTRINVAGLLNNGTSDLAIVGEGVDPDKEARLGSYMRITAGRQLQDADRSGVLVGNGVARALRLEPGSRVNVVVSTPEGAMNSLDFDLIGVFQTISRDYDARAIRIPIAAAQELIGTPRVNLVVLSLVHTGDTDRVAQYLRARLPAQLDVKTWHELSDFYAKTVDLYQAQFGALRLIVLLMVVLGVANSMNMSIFEREAEFATMRALGGYDRHIFRLIVAEAALVGVAGALLGALLGCALGAGLSAVGIPMPPPPNADVGYTARIQLEGSGVLIACLIGLASTMLAALMPAFKVSRAPLATALRRGQ